MTDSEAVASERQASRRPSNASSASSSSDSDDATTSDARQSIQWLATAREKRSTAGNRMKSMLANEEPDSDLELLFAEDDDDQGFSDAGDDASDVHMDSSSDDEDDNNAAGAGGSDLEGEKELEQQAKDKRAAQRKKRKAADAIPAKFRKKVRIDPTTTTNTSSNSTTPRPPGRRESQPAPAPRPKKKSERASWLPSAADQPTRASLRDTTRASKEQLHAQMEEREARRLKQVAQMQKKAERLEALKKPPMTQEERLREAEIVERRNAKSLNRWEEAEKQREEERRAKLAALSQRTLEGPVITFWSGTREWKDDGAGGGGGARYVMLEEKPKRKPREKKDKTVKDKGKAGEEGKDEKGEAVETPPPPTQTSQDGTEVDVKNEPSQESTAPKNLNPPPLEQGGSLAAPVPPPPPPPSGLAAPAPPPQNDDKAADPRQSNNKPSGVLAAPKLAPPAGIQARDPSPNEANSPASLLAAPSPQPQLPSPQPIAPAPATKDLEQLRDGAATNGSATPSEQAPGTPSAETTTYTSTAIVFQNFDDGHIKDKAVQTQILFGRKMNKLSKPPPLPICVITNHPAKYRDPKTGLPFYNSYAYRQIQRLCKGEYKWSKLLGAWVGAGQFAAKGVPDRFLNPNAPPPKKPSPPPPPSKKEDQSAVTAPAENKDGDVKIENAPPVPTPAMNSAAAVNTQTPQQSTITTPASNTDAVPPQAPAPAPVPAAAEVAPAADQQGLKAEAQTQEPLTT